MSSGSSASSSDESRDGKDELLDKELQRKLLSLDEEIDLFFIISNVCVTSSMSPVSTSAGALQASISESLGKEMTKNRCPGSKKSSDVDRTEVSPWDDGQRFQIRSTADCSRTQKSDVRLRSDPQLLPGRWENRPKDIQFVFRHYDDLTEYIEQYRREYTNLKVESLSSAVSTSSSGEVRPEPVLSNELPEPQIIPISRRIGGNSKIINSTPRTQSEPNLLAMLRTRPLPSTGDLSYLTGQLQRSFGCSDGDGVIDRTNPNSLAPIPFIRDAVSVSANGVLCQPSENGKTKLHHHSNHVMIARRGHEWVDSALLVNVPSALSSVPMRYLPAGSGSLDNQLLPPKRLTTQRMSEIGQLLHNDVLRTHDLLTHVNTPLKHLLPDTEASRVRHMMWLGSRCRQCLNTSTDRYNYITAAHK